MFSRLWRLYNNTMAVTKMLEKLRQIIVKYWQMIASLALLFLLLGIFPLKVGLGLFIVIYLTYIGLMVWRAREQITVVKHYIETVIWGKPLHLFGSGELKNTKVKVVWRRDNGKAKK